MTGLLKEVPEVMPPNVVTDAKREAPMTLLARRLTLASHIAFAVSLFVVLIAGNPGWAGIALVSSTALLSVVTSVWLVRCLSHDIKEARTRAELLNWHVYELMPSQRR
jgi:hypothetical protein